MERGFSNQRPGLPVGAAEGAPDTVNRRAAQRANDAEADCGNPAFCDCTKQ